MGQKLDTCPKFVLYLSMHPIYFTSVSIFAHKLDKNGTIVRHWSYICHLSVHTSYSFYNYLYLWTSGGQKWDNIKYQYQTCEPYQIVACWFDNIGTFLGTKLLSNFSSLCAKIEMIIEWIGCLDRKRTNLGLMSNYCPIFVHLMCKNRNNCRMNKVCWQKEDKFRAGVQLLSYFCPGYV